MKYFGNIFQIYEKTIMMEQFELIEALTKNKKFIFWKCFKLIMLQNSSNKTQQNSILKRKNTKNQILMEKSFFFILKTQNMLSKTVERCVIIGNFSIRTT